MSIFFTLLGKEWLEAWRDKRLLWLGRSSADHVLFYATNFGYGWESPPWLRHPDSYTIGRRGP